MDYEKKYKEVLEKARKRVATEPQDHTDAILKDIFPELRESEDERIRKELKEAFEAYDIESKWNGIPIRSIFAWLEKQKEQKPVDYDHEMWKNCEANFEGGKKEVIEHPEKYGLQKPAWSEEDEKMIWDIVDVLEADNVENKKKFPYALSLHERYKKMVDWLKSLRPQPEQEWSKEETKDLVHILKVLDDCYIYGTHDLSKTDYDNLTSTLKSLRPSWKPSEEQMAALEAATVRYQSTGLESLYEDLKKLM